MATPWTSIVAYTIPAGGAIANVLAGFPVEYIGHAATITIYASGDAAGDTFSLTGFGGDAPGVAYIPAATPVPVASTAGSVKTNENFVGMFAVPANSRLVLALVGTAAHVGRFQFVVS